MSSESSASKSNGQPAGSADAKALQTMESVVIRFCGDSGDGMQLAGTQFTNVSAVFGNDVSTLPDFPAEIRAPAGSLFGVSGFQVCFSSGEVFTPGDEVNTLVAMNPAALKTNLEDLQRGGTLIVNEDAFDKGNLQKAHYDSNPLDDVDGNLAAFRVHKVPMTRLTRDSVEGLGLTVREADRCKNFFALGLVFWLYDRDSTPTEDWVKEKFAKHPSIVEANLRALKAGYNYGFSTEQFTVHYEVPSAELEPGRYRKITGNEAVAMGLAAAAKLAEVELFYGGYPITPASDILHELSKLKRFGIKTFQAEDEIAAITSVVGAAFGGALAVTASSGPGIALKGEGIGLGVITELPMIIVNVQRGGPSTGLPTKTEQSDLFLSYFGRNGDCPMPVIAARSPADCFQMAQEAVRIAVEFMTPVFLMTDGYIANGAEPWKIPAISDLKKVSISHPQESNGNGDGFLPYLRDENLVRPWAVPGTPGLEHRLGGLEKADGSGNVSYDPDNHDNMTRIRAQKIMNIAESIPEQEVEGPESGDLLVVSWGGTYGAVKSACMESRRQGKSVAHCHLQYIHPFPKNLGTILKNYKKVLIPELNGGQMWMILRGLYLVDAVSFSKVKGKPFLIGELCAKIDEVLES
ncbi:2-oxoacid:acceptor oxidoreductase subunit alpha [Thalassoglobus polymorphus]|uniref:2-oxoglutarate oxidoreductase subunit KorA n=1 Tax=Thalassoglobus polymorphus TaxID=2527994 RepID=A0A517QUD0_9PLAN|nr:2-oxoacid:acceptor oxidoreductase subunit alpha [Thalassoglobus polymorphus]QDT35214.1 2-oxoglutarate oxidoreductase subunit KorA [Thalassoglobus polymorphus]